MEFTPPAIPWDQLPSWATRTRVARAAIEKVFVFAFDAGLFEGFDLGLCVGLAIGAVLGAVAVSHLARTFLWRPSK